VGEGSNKINMKILQNKYFKNLTTFRIGGKIKYYAEVKGKKEIEEIVCFAKSNHLKVFIIGGGSDFLVSDKLYDGLVIKFTGTGVSISGDSITAEAGMSWDKLVEYSVKNNFQGIECLSGIPGTVGAAPIQNIGAYGQELKDTFESLNAFDITKENFVKFNKEDCGFGYRESIFKQKSHWQKYLITDITLRLHKNGKPTVNYESLNGRVKENPSLLDVRNAILAVRKERLEDPNIVGNAGSFFKNPIVDKNKKEQLEKDFPGIKIFPFGEKYKVFSGFLIENAGWKGKNLGSVGVSPKHALIIINKSGNAKASDVIKLSNKIVEDVDKMFGLRLEPEVQMINF